MNKHVSPEQYWLSFANEWDKLSRYATEAGTFVDGVHMGTFFGELADDAADMWAMMSHHNGS